MQRSSLATLFAIATQLNVSAQLPPTSPSIEFEVATIRASEPPPPGSMLAQRMATAPRTNGGPGISDSERIMFSHMPLRMLLYIAYDVHPDQISGPNWLDSETFDINAKVPAGATKEQVNVMLRTLLIERFKIMIHQTVQQDNKAYDLVIAKSGPKLKEAEHEPTATGPTLEDRFAVKLDADGFPVIPDGQVGSAHQEQGSKSNHMPWL